MFCAPVPVVEPLRRNHRNRAREARAPAGAQDVPAGLVATVRPAFLQDANVFTLRSGGSATDPPLKPAR